MQRFLDWPDWVVGALVVALALLIGPGGVLLTRKWVARLPAVALHNEVVSYYGGTGYTREWPETSSHEPGSTETHLCGDEATLGEMEGQVCAEEGYRCL